MIEANNAHPFCFNDHLVGAHNGTLWPEAEKRLKASVKESDLCGTDSELIFANLAVYEDPKTTIEKLQGAWALSWWDGRNDTINFIRNKERPLFYAFDEDRKILVWASLAEMILLGFQSNLIKLPKDTKVHYLPEDTLITWKIPTVNDKFSEEPLKRQRMTGYTPVYTSTNYNKNGFSGGTATKWDGDEGGEEYYANGYYSMGAPRQEGQHWNCETSRYEYPFQWISGKEILKDGWKEVTRNGKKAYEFDKKLVTAIVVPPKKTDLRLATSNTNHPRTELSQEQLKAWTDISTDFKGLSPIYSNPSFKCFWDNVIDMYRLASWDDASKTWKESSTKTCPTEIPLTFVNWESGQNHNFKYETRKNNKTGVDERLVFYKGYRNFLYTSAIFSKLVKEGCLNCDRKDVQWGNEVVFVDNSGHFLCEHCRRDSTMVKQLCRTGTDKK